MNMIDGERPENFTDYFQQGLRPLQRELEKAGQLIDGPFFFYDLDGLATHLKRIRHFHAQGLKVWYACKANPLSAILQEIKQAGLGIDIASKGELSQALAVGFAPNNMLATGPAKSKEYLRQLLYLAVDTIVLESPNQVLWLHELAMEQGPGFRPRALLRLQLDWQEGRSVLGGGEITPFGMGQASWATFFAEHPLPQLQIDFLGIHVFQWGNLLGPATLKKIWREITTQAQAFARQISLQLIVLDLGGGLGIPYGPGATPLDFGEIFQILMEIKREFQIPNIWLELGRFLVGEAGVYAAKIVDRKNVRGKELLILEGGINHLIRPSLVQDPFPCIALAKASKTLETFTLHGPLCTALDQLGTYQLPANLTIGDWLYFPQTGSYGFTESMPFFLCHDLPAEVILKHQKLRIVREQQSAATWLR